MTEIERQAKIALNNILNYIGKPEYKATAQLVTYIEWAIKNTKEKLNENKK